MLPTAVAIAALLGVIAQTASNQAAWASVVAGPLKIRSAKPGVAGPEPKLELARGECGSFQVAVGAGPRGLPSRVQAKAAPLIGEGGHLGVALYREGWIEVTTPSNREGASGWWPDALIPARDALVHEERNAFPFDVAARHPEAIYAEVCVPRQQPPGLYRGTLALSAKELRTLELPVEVRVSPVVLPATSSLPNSFGFSGITACRLHGCDPARPQDLVELSQRYATLALAHRISLHGMTMEPPGVKAGPGGVALDFSSYDAELAPFLDGTALPSGARFTSTDVRWPPAALAPSQRASYWAQTRDHLAKKGWLSRAFVYAPDEPTPEQFGAVRALAEEIHRSAPGLRVLITASLQPGLQGAADIWTPNLNCLFHRGAVEYCRATEPSDGYGAERAAGKSLWWYQSCGSHGCGGPLDDTTAAYFSGWPSYMIDHPLTANRAMGVEAFAEGIEGELYYNTVEDYGGDPWRDAFRFGGNGDGTLFYPGLPKEIGGHTGIPLASLRLKAIRDGLQDFELLALARKAGLGAQALTEARRLVPKPWEITRDPAAWEDFHHRMLQLLEERSASNERGGAASNTGRAASR